MEHRETEYERGYGNLPANVRNGTQDYGSNPY
jgi:hypothetical protein